MGAIQSMAASLPKWEVTSVIAGLPWSAWLLLIAAIGPGLALTAFFYARRRGKRGDR